MMESQKKILFDFNVFYFFVFKLVALMVYCFSSSFPWQLLYRDAKTSSDFIEINMEKFFLLLNGDIMLYHVFSPWAVMKGIVKGPRDFCAIMRSDRKLRNFLRGEIIQKGILRNKIKSFLNIPHHCKTVSSHYSDGMANNGQKLITNSLTTAHVWEV